MGRRKQGRGVDQADDIASLFNCWCLGQFDHNPLQGFYPEGYPNRLPDSNVQAVRYAIAKGAALRDG